MVKYSIIILSLLLTGCTGKNITVESSIEEEIDAPEIITHKKFNEILNKYQIQIDYYPRIKYKSQWILDKVYLPMY